jgi:hypothetical protein
VSGEVECAVEAPVTRTFRFAISRAS